MHSFIPTFVISYGILAALISSLILPALAAPIPHGYHTGSQRAYPVSSPSSPWSHIYTYGKLADKFLMVNDAYLTDGAPWQNSMKAFNAASAYRFPQQYRYKPPQAPVETQHPPPQFQPSDAVRHVHYGEGAGAVDENVALMEKFRKYAVLRSSALANMQRKIWLRKKARENTHASESPSVEGEEEAEVKGEC